jgi:hypothetical protein
VRQAFVTAVAAAVSLLTLVSPPAFANNEAPAIGRHLAGDAVTSPAGGKHARMVRAHSRAIRFVSHRRDLPAPLPAGGEALVQWCFRTVVTRHGYLAPTLDRPHRVAMNTDNAVRMTDACVRTHGEID